MGVIRMYTDHEYLQWEYDAYMTARRRQRTRMERMRRTVRRQKIIAAAAVVLAVFSLALWLTQDASAAPEGPEPNPEAICGNTLDVKASAPCQLVADLSAADAGAEQAEKAPGIDLAKLPRIENVTLTHYCICRKCCGKTPEHPAYGITASGRTAEPYLSVAVDPILIELGSTVYVDYGDGEIHTYRADDTGSAVNGAHIDLCVAEHEEARQLGVKTVTVWWEERP